MRIVLMQISIVVPVFNESATLPSLMQALQSWQSASHSNFEILFVDGGSTDNTVAMLQKEGYRVISSSKGRAWQMNTGAAQTQHNVLLFLHADTQLPKQALELIDHALNEQHCWGRFDVRILGKPWMLKVVARMMNWRSRITGIATGDQAMFMTRDAFNQVGGFPGQALMEDIEISKRLCKLSPPACISVPVLTSGRRWEERGVWRTIVLMWRLRLAYWLGQKPDVLAKQYR